MERTSLSAMLMILTLLAGAALQNAAFAVRVPRRQDTGFYSYNNLLGMQEQVAAWTKPVASENAFKPLLSRQSLRQKLVPTYVPFPCAHNQTVSPRSSTLPSSVHRLRPGDIDVVAAIGDSLTAGDAALEDYALGIFIQYRGVSWCMGGQADWRTYLTLPNILKHFNPNITGYSLGEGSFQAKNSRFNIAMPAALDDDALKQARILVTRIRADPAIDFHKSWKLVTIFIGHNDLCSKACFEPQRHTAQQHAAQLRRALDFLQLNLPRTFVNLVSIADVTFSLRVQRSMMCRMLHHLLCACLHRGQMSQPAEFIERLAHEYSLAEQELVSSGRYDGDPQFTVELQRFTDFTHALGLSVSEDNVLKADPVWLRDPNLIGPDCFHMSQAGSALFANMAWNNLLEANGNKSADSSYRLFQRFLCPSERAPFLFTRINSEVFLRTGYQYSDTL